ncbi:MAG: hypothetical protein M1816_002928 [Peltula sp. TS41687]|nr:MAG: hypothetical protein M1816_002928 [Peltula sp. TS41687]
MNRTFTTHLHRQSTIHPQASSNGPSAALQTRINEKKVELENLQQLRDLSAGLARQMQTLEEKLVTLTDSTEAIAVVLSNWHNVLRAINMASVNLPKPKNSDDEENAPAAHDANAHDVPLPQTLVRMPLAREPNRS